MALGLNNLTTVNIELTSLCNKNCWMCGRRKIDRDYPEISLAYGDMDFELVKKIAEQLPEGIMVQLHNNGEPLLYKRFGEAAQLFHKQIRNIVTNGKLLVKKADQIIDNLETITVSVIEDDDEAEKQYKILLAFLKIKQNQKPNVILRLNGNIQNEARYTDLGLVCAHRNIHAPEGSVNYTTDPTVPEAGICLDYLNHLAINKDGDVSICVRFDPNRLGVLGNLKNATLTDLWNSEKQKQWLNYHILGQREKVPLCSKCHFWGVPTGKNLKKILDIDTNKIII